MLGNRGHAVRLGGTARSPEDALELYRMGLAFAEVAIPDADRFLHHLEAYRRLRGDTGLFFLCHGPKEGDPNNVDTLERVYLPKIARILSIMPQLEMGLLTIHLWLDPRFVRPDVIAYKVGLLQRILRQSDALGITLCLENLSEQADHLGGVWEALPSLRLTLDLGHAQLLAESNTGFGFMERCPERIRHVHLHDNRGGSSVADDLRLPLGEGSLDFAGLFGRLKRTGYDRTMTLELRPHEIRRNLDPVRQRLLSAGWVVI